jgi:hypothetical protein
VKRAKDIMADFSMLFAVLAAGYEPAKGPDKLQISNIRNFHCRR